MSEIDLHTHSTASDGSLTPANLIAQGKRKNIQALALTDHDTTNGLSEAIRAGEHLEVEVIPGCELSVDFSLGQMHLLGLWISLPAIELENHLQFLRDKRHGRNKKIVEKLNNQGVSIGYDDVLTVAGKGTVGRPHIARTLLQKGYVASIAEAFERYIGPSGSAYVPKTKLSPQQAISILKQVKATVILAHPFSLALSPRQLEEELKKLIEMGLDGLEVYYSKHTREQTTAYLKLCKKYSLLVSGGSDFHGQAKPDIKLGTGKNNNLHLPYTLVEALKEARIRNGLWITRP